MDGVLLTSTEDIDMQWKYYLIDLLLQADQSLHNHSKILVCISVSKSDLLLMIMLSSELESVRNLHFITDYVPNIYG